MKIRWSDCNLINSLSAVSRLPPPVNVSIQCDNYGVEARWEYPDLSQDVCFIVEVKGSLDTRYEWKKKTPDNNSFSLLWSLNVYFSLIKWLLDPFKILVKP